MLAFNPAHPFPFLEIGSVSLSAMQAHAAAADTWLGLEIEKVERGLLNQGCRLKASGASREQQELWIGLASQDLLTPYIEIRAFLEFLAPQRGARIVDLGAAYGRMGFVIARHFPGRFFVGYEYVGERVREARRCLQPLGNSLIAVEHADLSDRHFCPAAADYYFLYDYGTTKAIEKTLYDLRRLAMDRAITVIARGRRSHEAIENRHPWLVPAARVQSMAAATVYRSSHLRADFVRRRCEVFSDSNSESSLASPAA